MKVSEIIEIKAQSHKGTWMITHLSGFGSDGSRARLVKLSKKGTPIKNAQSSINLTFAQIQEAIAG